MFLSMGKMPFSPEIISAYSCNIFSRLLSFVDPKRKSKISVAFAQLGVCGGKEGFSKAQITNLRITAVSVF